MFDFNDLIKTQESSYILYDKKARPIRNFSTNYLGGFIQTDSKVDFSGKIIFTEITHKRLSSSNTIIVREDFAYSDQDRLLTHTHKINNEAIQLLAENTYDELGQLISKNVGNTVVNNPLQKVDYSYNIRGWLTEINKAEQLGNNYPLNQPGEPNDLFAFKINYNDLSGTSADGVVKLYNGNIAETFWRTANDNQLRSYGYQYDNLNRLLNATYQKPETNEISTHSYDETISYDKNGNITTLHRNGEYDDNYEVLVIDKLSYVYNNNQLLTVFDESIDPNGFKDEANSNGINDPDIDYTYDANGNMTSDENKDIFLVEYNHMNLPKIIIFSQNGEKKIYYLYNALGQKIQKRIFNNGVFTTTDYLSGFQYFDTALQFFPTAEGYVNNTIIGPNNHFNYVFNYTDHLGNIRLSYGLDEEDNLKIIEENNYYPFGLKHNNYNVDKRRYEDTILGVELRPCTDCPYNYKYNGKELQDELGLNFYDFGARNYDPALGRWMNIDPLAEVSRRWSPYTYCYNNPIRFVDPDGMRAIENDDWYENNETHEIEWFEGSGARDGYAYIGPSAFQDNGNGTSTLYNEDGTSADAINLEEVKVFNTNQSYFQGYFDGPNSGEYGAYIPDATGITLSASVNTGLFGNFSVSIGGAIDRQNNTEGFVAGNFELGLNNSKGIPSFNGGLTIDFHDNYIEGQNNVSSVGVLSGLGGENRTFAGGVGNFIGGYSYSGQRDSSGVLFKASQGVETKSFGIGINSGISGQVGGSRGITVSEIIKKYF